jgi:hypothetical protein
MEAIPRLPTRAGKAGLKHPITGKRTLEMCGDEVSVGMTKFYRVSCFLEIGGFVRQVMWDGIDCHRARMLGWMAEAYEDEELRFLHLRVQGSSERGVLRGRVRAGFGNYFMGTSPLYLLAIAANRVGMHPAGIGSMATVWGYVSSAAKGLPRYEDEEFRRYLRRFQHLALRKGKARAIRELNEEGAAVWQARRKAKELRPTRAGDTRVVSGLGT